MPISEKDIKDRGKKIIAGTVVAATVLGSGIAADALGADDKEKYEKYNSSHISADIGYDTVDTFTLGEKIEGVEQVPSKAGMSLLANFVLTPLWFVLKLILKIASPIISPVVGALRFIAFAFAAVVAGLKLKYPEIPLKEILTKKRTGLILAIIISAYLLVICLPVFFPEIERYMNVAKMIAAVLAVTIILLKTKMFRPKKVKYEIQF